MSHNKNDKEPVSGDKQRRHLHLVEHSEKEKSRTSLPEADANELRELIAAVQHKAPRKKKIEDDLLPPAA